MSATKTRSEEAPEHDETTDPVNPDEETGEEIDGDDLEPEDEPQEPQEPSSLTVVEGIDKALEAESRRHRKALEKALGEQFADFDLCPLCQIDGYAMQYPLGAIGPEQRAAIMTVMGEYGDAALKEHPTEVRCEVCDGWGEMLNGSRNEAHRKSACQTCMGTGHVSKPVATNVQPLYSPPPVPWQTQAPQPDYTQPNTDSWGRPLGHQHFGLDPASVGV